MQILYDFNGTIVLLSVFDYFRQTNLEIISERYITSADFIILLYDIANTESFKKLKTWITRIEKNKIEKKVLLLGYSEKPESEVIRKITYKEGERLADNKEFLFYELTPEDDRDATKIFWMLAEKLLFDPPYKAEEEIHDEEKTSLCYEIFYCFS